MHFGSRPILTLFVCLAACTADPSDPTTTNATGDGDGDPSTSAESETTATTNETVTSETGSETATETGAEMRECDPGLTLCCPDGQLDCADEFYLDEQLWGCIDTSTSSGHCGMCDNHCPTDKLLSGDIVPTDCVEGVCEPTLGACLLFDANMNCDQACGESGKVCVEQGCHGNTMFLYGEGSFECTADSLAPDGVPIGCSDLPPPEFIDTAILMSCCCD